MANADGHLILHAADTRKHIGIVQTDEDETLWAYTGCCAARINWHMEKMRWVCSGKCGRIVKYGAQQWPSCLEVSMPTENLIEFVAQWCGYDVDEILLEVFE